MRTEIIGEVGECFNGDFEMALKMIEEIKNAGCDIVKFQILDMGEVALDDPERDWFSQLELTPEKITKLIAHAQRCQIDILFTPVSVKTAGWMYEAGCQMVKIASSFLRKEELIAFINRHFRKAYVSTGMASLDEIRKIVSMLDKIEEIIILHCISEYPTGPLLEQRGLTALREEDAHLNMMTILQEEFPEYKIGYSDHTDGIFVPITAAAMGASVIEKHITLDRRTPIEHFEKGLSYMGTDHVLSIEPEQLREMVLQIRRVETVRGNKVWERSMGEKVLAAFLKGRWKERKSIEEKNTHDFL